MDRVCHFEIPYGDKKRIETFYRSVFGWNFMDFPGDTPYTFALTTEVDQRQMPTQPGGINGGLYPRGDQGGSQTPVLVIEVVSCEQRVKDVESAGGSKVLGPFPISGMGIYAQVKDSEGNIIGLWQSLAPTVGSTSSPEPASKKSKATVKKKASAAKKQAPAAKKPAPAAKKQSPAVKGNKAKGKKSKATAKKK